MKNKKCMIIACLPAVLTLVLAVGGVYAAVTTRVSVKNRIETGDVNISLTEYSVKDGKEILYQSPETILPGETISKIPRIKNLAADCYVRAAFTFLNGRKDLEGLTEKEIFGIPAEWKKAGPYFYMTKPLKAGSTADLFQGVRIPADWDNAHAGQTLGLRIRVDAIQEANFQPDFASDHPWGERNIELCVHKTTVTGSGMQGNVQNIVEYKGDSYKLVASPEDFFANLPLLMPGDAGSDKVQIKNTTNQETEILFYGGYENQSREQRELLDALALEIRQGEKVIYQGSLKEDSLNRGVSLGSFKPGDEAVLDFKVSMPAELGNAYAVRDAAVKWIFEARREEASPDQKTGGTSIQSAAAGSWGEKGDPVKTGDQTPAAILAVIMIASGAIIVLVTWKKRRRYL